METTKSTRPMAARVALKNPRMNVARLMAMGITAAQYAGGRGRLAIKKSARTPKPLPLKPNPSRKSSARTAFWIRHPPIGDCDGARGGNEPFCRARLHRARPPSEVDRRSFPRRFVTLLCALATSLFNCPFSRSR